MKVSLLKISRKKEVINRLKLSELAEMIRKSPEEPKFPNITIHKSNHGYFETNLNNYHNFDHEFE